MDAPVANLAPPEAAIPVADAAAAAALPPFVAGAAAPPAGGGGAVGASWENLKNGAGHLPHEVGAALWVSHGDATDQDVVAPLLTMGERPENADLTNLFRQWVDDPDDKYYLVAIGKKVEVLHQLRSCHATAGNGQRVLCLLGERKMVAGIVVPPKLQSLRGQVNNQVQAIARQEVAAPTMNDIATLYRAPRSGHQCKAVASTQFTTRAASHITNYTRTGRTCPGNAVQAAKDCDPRRDVFP